MSTPSSAIDWSSPWKALTTVLEKADEARRDIEAQIDAAVGVEPSAGRLAGAIWK